MNIYRSALCFVVYRVFFKIQFKFQQILPLSGALITYISKLIFHIGTVPETFYFPIFAFVHRSLTVRSPCVQRALIVRSSFTVLRSAFTVRSRSPFTKRSAFAHRSFTYRSQSVHRSFSVQSSLSFGTLKLKDQYHDLGKK